MDYETRPNDWHSFKECLASRALVAARQSVKAPTDCKLPHIYEAVRQDLSMSCGKELWKITVPAYMCSAFDAFPSEEERYDFLLTLVKESVRKANRLLRGLLDVWYIHTGRLIKADIWKHFVCKWTMAFLADVGEKYYKYQSSYFFCLVTRQFEFPEVIDLPHGEKHGFLLPSKYYRELRTMISRGNDSDIGLAYALMDVKRAGLPLSEFQKQQFIEKHKKNMSGAQFQGLNNTTIINHIQRRIVDFLNEMKVPANHVERMPSLSATCESTRSEGGFCGSVQYLLRELYGQPYMLYMVCDKGKLEVIYDFTKEEVDLLIRDMATLEMNISAEHLDNHLRAEVHLVYEPFKIRPITCGAGYVYHLARCYQKVFHERLRSMEPFTLIGKSWDSSFASRYLHGSLCKFWNAGDFSAATDGINRYLQEYVTDLICREIYIYGDQLVARCVRRSMGMHRLTYPDKTELKQAWGQLMGTPFSFLVLCIINFCTTWASLEESRGLDLTYTQFVRDHRPLINGDDNLFGFNSSSEYECWVEYCREAGLNRSPGKNYVSSDFCMVNSRPMKIHRGERDQVRFLTEIFTCNPGLLRGQGRVLSDTRTGELDDEDIDQQLSSACDQLSEVSQFGDRGQRARVIERFRWNLRKKLHRSNRSWVLDRALGGLGLPFGSATYGQRKLAGGLLITTVREKGRDKDGYSFQDIAIGRAVPVHVREAIKRSITLAKAHAIHINEVIWTDNQPSPPFQERDQYGTMYHVGTYTYRDRIRSRFDKMRKKVLSMPYVHAINENKIHMAVHRVPAGRAKLRGREVFTESEAWLMLEIQSRSW